MWVIHETGGLWPSTFKWLDGSNGVSIQWFIRRTGEIICCSSDFDICAHAGEAAWLQYGVESGEEGWGWANLRSEGVELEGLNTGQPITEFQYNSLLHLTRWRIQELNLLPEWIVRHKDIAGVHVRKANPKVDPLGLDWTKFITELYPEHLRISRGSRCTEIQFAEVLGKYKSPAQPEASAIFGAFIKKGIDPGVALGFFEMESNCGTATSIPGLLNNYNWGNLKTGGKHANGKQFGFAKYSSWLEGARDFADRLIHYQEVIGLGTVERVVPIYAPRHDKNNPDAYVQRIKNRLESFKLKAEIPGATFGSSIPAASVDKDVAEFYHRFGGILTFGFPLQHQFTQPDLSGENCHWLVCENAILKKKESLPAGWRIRPALLKELVELKLL